MAAPITDAKSKPMPSGIGIDVSDALAPFLEPLSYKPIAKAVSEGITSETEGDQVNFTGVIQPLSARQLMLKAEAQRAFRWRVLMTDKRLALNLDDRVVIKGVRYRVAADADWTSYGIWSYQLVEDYADTRAT